jgi:adsorption protein B
MVQTPVFPLEVPAHYFTAGTYADEFAEVHSKDMYVREWVGGFVPSAGVGTAISRKVFARFKNRFGDNFFNPNTLTEDYDFSLRLRLAGLRAIFVRQPILRRKSVRTFFGKEKIKWVKEFIVTRAHFPHTFKTAVRQRTRWSLGIIFQGWKTIGWKGELQVLWMLFHDRKGAWTNSTLLFGYLFTLYLIISELLRATIRPDLPTVLPDHEWINWAVYICAGLMINRLLQRVIATSRIYNLWQGFLAAPRMIWGNVINAFATIRAAKQFFNAERKGTKIAWDKTKHYFPSAPELPLRQQNASSNIN